jgi:hypothetical protein
MSSIQLINSIVEWERRIQFEDERRNFHRDEPVVNYLAKLGPARKEHRSIFAQIFGNGKKQQPVNVSRKEKPCKDPQPC